MTLKLLPHALVRAYALAPILGLAMLLGLPEARGQLALPAGTSYSQNFDSIGDGLPSGWTVRTGANASGRGTGATLTTAATTWGDTGGSFKNVASATDGASGDSTAIQNGRTNRALGIRQSTAFGDPGAAFELEIADTLGKTNFQLSLLHQMLSLQARSTVWSVQYSLDGSAWTTLGTYEDPGAFGSTPANYPLGAALDNLAGPIYLRVVALSGTTGSGTRDTYGIDDFQLAWTSGGPVPPSVTSAPATAITKTAATLNGEVVAQGTTAVSARGFVYSTIDPAPVLAAPNVTNVPAGSGTGSFSTNLTGLPLGTVHYFRAYATNAQGTSYGTSLQFRTDDDGYTAGNLAVLLAAASANNTDAAVIELLPTEANQPAPISRVDIPATGPSAIRISGSATSTGYVARSADRSLLAFTGHNNDATGVNANTLTSRAVVTLDRERAVSLAATYTGASGNQTRGATSLNNSAWFIGDQGGVYTNGADAPDPDDNIRGVKTFGGTVYLLRTSATLPPVSTISAASGGTIAGLPGLPEVSSNFADFHLVASGANGIAHDVLYMVQTTSATVGTVHKYSLVSGTWVSNGTYTTNFGGFGLAAAQRTGGGALLYLTTGNGATAANRVVRLSDTAGHNATLTILEAETTTLHTAAAGTILKGLDFVPEPGSGLLLQGALTRFEQTYGNLSTAQSFTVSGTGLGGPVTVSAPAGFELALAEAGPYASSVQAGAAGNLASTTVWVRLARYATAGDYNGLSLAASASGVPGTTLAIPDSAVLRRVITVTANNASKTYDGSPFTGFTATLTGFAEGETEAGLRAAVPAQLSGQPTFSGAAVGAVNGGGYAIVPVVTALSATNYSFTAANGTLTINRATQSVTFPPLPDSYTNAQFPVSATASSGLPVFFTSLTPATASVAGSLVTVTGAGGGSATIQASLAQSQNFEAASETRSFAIFASAEAEWRQRSFGSTAIPPSGWYEVGGGGLSDSDDDELPDLGEFAFGLNPNQPDYQPLELGLGGVFSNGSPFLFRAEEGDEAAPVARYLRRADGATAGLTYTPQFSGDGVAWTNAAGAGAVVALGGGFELVELPLPTPLPSPGESVLFRVRVVYNGTDVYASDPVGHVATDAAGNSDTWLSAPFHRSPVFRGKVSLRSESTVTLARASFEPDTLAGTHYLQVVSGGGAGRWYEISGNTAAAATVESRGDDLAAILASDTIVRVLPHHTLASLFPGGSGLKSSPDLLPRSRVLLPDLETAGIDLAPPASFFLYSGADHGGPGWRRFGTSPTQRFDDTPLPPTTPFRLRHETSGDTLVRQFGFLDRGRLVLRLATLAEGTPQDSALALAVPASVSLAGSGLYESGAFAGSPEIEQPTDAVLVYDGAPLGYDAEPSAIFYYYLGGSAGPAGWRALGAPDAVRNDASAFLPASGVVVRKATTGAPAALPWTYLPPYSPDAP